MPDFLRPAPAPLVADILCDPQEMQFRSTQPLYIKRRSVQLPSYERDETVKPPTVWIEATSEADGLRELDAYLGAAATFLAEVDTEASPKNIETVEGLRKGLRLIGRIERTL